MFPARPNRSLPWCPFYWDGRNNSCFLLALSLEMCLGAAGGHSQEMWRKSIWGKEAGLQREAEVSKERLLDPIASGTQLHPCPAHSFLCGAIYPSSFLAGLNWISVICCITHDPDGKQKPLT